MMKKAGMWLSAAMLVLSASLATAQDDFRLTLLHTNDTHAGHAPQSNGNGGVALQAAVADQIIAEGGNVLTLDAGDRFTGTLFHTVYVGEDQIQVMNQLGYNAMTLGNHEFDNGDDRLLAFLKGVDFPVVSANIDFSALPEYEGLVEPYTLLEVGGQQVGIIGLTTADTVDSSSPNDAIVFDADYATIANAAAQELLDQGVNKIILLTHIGIQEDLLLLPQLKNIDVVLGGHSHTLLSNIYNGASDRYPIVADDADGNSVYYAQTGSNNVYLGRMDVRFDADGVVSSASGDTILLSRYITPNAEVSALIETLSGPVNELRLEPINATTDVFLQGDRTVCRIEECNLGNVIADAMRDSTDVQIALMNGGGIRASIEPGDITLGEVLTVQPFGNLMATFEITGTDLRAALENSVGSIRLNDAGQIERDGGAGRFLQVSGLRFTYDPTAESGSRVVSVEVEAADGTFEALDDAAIYSVVTNSFVRQGGDGYTMFAENATNVYDFGSVDYEVTSAYLAAISPISLEVEADNARITALDVEVEPLP